MTVDSWAIIVPALVAILAWWLNERGKRNWEKWQMKKTACINALNIANAILSNYKYQNVGEGDLVPQYESVRDVRACFNELACICDGPQVLDELRKIAIKGPTPDAIVDLRNAVRKELGLSRGVVDQDRENAFIGKVNCDTPG